MTDRAGALDAAPTGLDAARRDRSLLERLAARIPGYRGLAERDLRREVDQRQREHLADEVQAAKTALRRAARTLTDAGAIAALGPLGRTETRLDRLAESIRFTDYGASGLFGVVTIDVAELEALYRFDLDLLDEVGDLRDAAERVAGSPTPGESLDAVERAADALDDRWSRRREVIDRIIQTRPRGDRSTEEG